MPEMTFTKKVKEELATLPFSDEHLKPLLAGIVRGCGSLIWGRTPQIKIKTELSSLAKLVFNTFKKLYDVTPTISFVKKMQFDKATVYHVIVQEKAYEILEDLECFQGIVRMQPKEMIKSSSIRPFITGLFLASGMVSDPQKSHYYLEIAFNNEDDAKLILKKLLAFKDDKRCSFKIIKRREKYVLYLKRSDEIPMFLSYIGATYMMMEFENTRLTKDFMNTENRLTICAVANYKKSADAGERNLQDIEIIKTKLGLFGLDDKTLMAIDLRCENTDASYGDIAMMMNDKQVAITKSGVVHIFSKLHELAKRLTNED